MFNEVAEFFKLFLIKGLGEHIDVCVYEEHNKISHNLKHKVRTLYREHYTYIHSRVLWNVFHSLRLVSYPAPVHLPVRNSLVNQVEFLGPYQNVVRTNEIVLSLTIR